MGVHRENFAPDLRWVSDRDRYARIPEFGGGRGRDGKTTPLASVTDISFEAGPGR